MDRKLTGKGERVRDRMIRETAKLIREHGFKAATVRAIAEQSRVNIASIRYYFGSKDELIGEAIDYLMNNFEHIVHHLDNPDATPEERLFLFMKDYFKLANIHPALYRSISFAKSETKQNAYFIYTNLLYDRCWKPVLENLSELSGISDMEILQIYATQFFASIEYPLILRANHSGAPGVQFIHTDHVETYIRTLLATFKEK